ncbi:MAG: MFS transporter [Gammaproteobacteria bacterium]
MSDRAPLSRELALAAAAVEALRAGRALPVALDAVLGAVAPGAGTSSGAISPGAASSGAVSAAVTALIADTTRDSQRTKAMAMVGGSIGLTFALSMVAAPLLYGVIGMGGIFALTGALALAGIAVVWWITPDAPLPSPEHVGARTRFRQVAFEPDLLRLNFGIFTLHAVQMAMFIVVPTWLVTRGGLPLADHWKLYLPVVLLSFVLMVPPLFWSERRGRLREIFVGAVALLGVVQGLFAVQTGGLVALAVLLLAFFVAFNLLEASLPSLVSRLAPVDAKGAALGIYNTTQSLGLFAGGLIGGGVQQHWGKPAVFVVCAALVAVWLALALRHRRWPTRRNPQAGSLAPEPAGGP